MPFMAMRDLNLQEFYLICYYPFYPIYHGNHCDTVNISSNYKSDKCNFTNNGFYWAMWEKL
jgi:hypothetical protein